MVVNSKVKGILAGLFANASFGVAVVWTKESFESYSPIFSSAVRVFVAVLGLFAYGVITGQLQKLKKKDLPYYLMCGFFVPFVFYVMLYEGITFMDAVVAGIIFSTLPLFSPLASYIAFKSKFNRLFFVGMIISFIGVLISVTSDGLMFDASPLGIVLMVLAVISFVSYSVLIKKLSVEYTSTSVVFYTSIIGFIFLAIACVSFEYQFIIKTMPSINSTMAIVYMGIISSFVGYLLYTYSIKILGVGRAMMFFNLVPVFTGIGAFVILGEDISSRKLFGMFVVIVGLYLTMLKVKKSNKMQKQKEISD